MGHQALHFIDSGKLCPDCGARLRIGVVDLGEFGGQLQIPEACECVRARKELERAALIAKGREAVRQARLSQSGLRKRWEGCRLDSIRPLSGQEEAYRLALDYTADFWKKGNRYEGLGLILCGGVGCGKTLFCAAIANAVIEGARIPDDQALRIGEGVIQPSNTSPVLFTSAVELLSGLKRSFYDRASPSADLMDRLKTVPLAIIDDLGAEKPTEWALERIFELVDYRYGEQLPVIVSTNATPPEMRSRFGDRVYDRLKEMCLCVPILTPSQRRSAAWKRP